MVPLHQKCDIRCGGGRIDITCGRKGVLPGQTRQRYRIDKSEGRWTENETRHKKSAEAEAAAQ